MRRENRFGFLTAREEDMEDLRSFWIEERSHKMQTAKQIAMANGAFDALAGLSGTQEDHYYGPMVYQTIAEDEAYLVGFDTTREVISRLQCSRCSKPFRQGNADLARWHIPVTCKDCWHWTQHRLRDLHHAS